MITSKDVYHVVAATIPLYVAMILAYTSVKWWKLFTPEQCGGINKFVAKFSIPLLSFMIISANNPYNMSLRLVLADSVQKLLAIVLIGVVTRFWFRGWRLSLVITGLSLSTLPNTLIIGVPVLKAMWGIKLPDVINNSIMILATGGLGMAMFSLGLFMASRASATACRIRVADVAAMAMKFVAGPALMALSSVVVGLRGRVLRVAIVQAALPQGIVPFVFAKEYNVHPDVLSTSVIFGMLIGLPISLVYYSLLAF
ncbi:unnamed protein product [Linum tenue]|uniref:Auxin efflux carrier component n=1 Tax=Linum tenue TaxID=586396 RepID=A0AAV0N4R6_9ROSI|nr:unnamed protein product [Linum tenue]